MCVGETMGLPGGHRGMSASAMQPSGLRVLALVTDAFGGQGGIAQYNRDFLSALAECEGVREVIILPRGGDRPPNMLPSGLRQLPPVQQRIAYSLSALRAAQTYGPFDLVFCGHVFMAPLAAAISKMLRAGLWFQVHGVEAWLELSTLHRRSIEMADLVTSVSRHTRRRLLEWVGISPDRVKVLPNTVDPRYQPGPKPGYLLDRHGVHGKKVLLTVSRLASSERYKGQDRVIRTLPRLLSEHPDIMYLIVGDGDDRQRLEALAVEQGVAEHVQFVGSVPPEELPDHFRLADVFVMPSTGEGFGIVFLEALATGIHVIAGRQDGSRDALCDGALGTLVEPENCDALASAIAVALQKPTRTIDCANKFETRLFAQHVHSLCRSLHFRAGCM
jgi:phosphatidylinositol alpha-1,6-mannosyltransferase